MPSLALKSRRLGFTQIQNNPAPTAASPTEEPLAAHRR
jgi:hypothetical protein